MAPGQTLESEWNDVTTAGSGQDPRMYPHPALAAAVASLMVLVPPGQAAQPAAAGQVVVLCEPGMPYYMANQAVSPVRLAEVLRKAKIPCRLASAAEAATLLGDPAVRVFVNVYGATYPEGLAAAFGRFHRRGGCLVSTGVPFTHPCRQEARGPVRGWRDRGVRPAGGHDKLGLATTRCVPAAASRVFLAADSPLRVEGLEEHDFATTPGAAVVWYLDPPSLAPEDEVLGAVVVWRRGKVRGYPVALVRHRCREFRGARDVWVGTGLLADPREPRQAMACLRLVAEGVVWCLREKGDLSAGRARRVLQALAKQVSLPPAPPKITRKPCLVPPLPRVLPARAPVALIVADLRGVPRDRQRALACLQGLANRKKPRIYLIFDNWDEEWLEWYRREGLVGRVVRKSANELLRVLVPLARGVVLTDETAAPVALTYAGAYDCVVAPPELARALHLPVAMDLRGRWGKRVEAMRWAKRELWPRCYHRAVYHAHPRHAPLPDDYIVAHRLFCFWLSGERDGWRPEAAPIEEMRFAHRLLGAMEPNGCVLGWWGWGDPAEGVGEYWGMSLASRYAELTIGTEFLSNATVLSALPAPRKLRQTLPPVPPLDLADVYVSLNVLDSGNDPWYWRAYQRKVWEKPGWEKVPVGWCLGPLTADLAPAILSWYYAHLPPGHELFCGPSGLGYMHLPEYAAACSNRQEVWRAYWRLTGRYCRRLDLRCVETYMGSWGEGTRTYRGGQLNSAALLCPGVSAWLPDLGRAGNMTADAASYLLDCGKPVFHCLTRWEPWRWSVELGERLGREEAEARGLVEQIRRFTPARRPAFMNCLLLSWTASPRTVRLVAERLGPQYHLVTPSQLAALYQKWAKARRRDAYEGRGQEETRPLRRPG